MDGTGFDRRDLRRDAGFARLLIDSHHRLVGRPLSDDAGGERADADWLYAHAPFCLLAHDTAPDPRFIYANMRAQQLFGYD